MDHPHTTHPLENSMPAFSSPSTASTHYAGPNWSTASYFDATASQPMELAALGEHLSVCRGSNRRWSTLRHLGGMLHGFAAPRFVTTLAVAAVLMGAALLVL
jgi:hypothetical protein